MCNGGAWLEFAGVDGRVVSFVAAVRGEATMGSSVETTGRREGEVWPSVGVAVLDSVLRD